MKKLIVICCLVGLLCSGSRRGRYLCLSNNLVAHWKMNDTAATDVVVDERGNYNGTFTDATGTATAAAHTTAGRVNSALNFDGTDDYIEVADHADFSFGDGSSDSPFSISAWIKMSTGIPSSYTVSKSPNSGDANSEWFFFISGSQLYIECVDASVGYATALIGKYANKIMSVETYYHVLATYSGDGTRGGLKLYIDGEIQTTTNQGDDTNYVAMENGTEVVKIGKAGAFYNTGIIDNVMIFNKELNTDEIKFLYNGGEGTERLSTYRSRY